MMFLKDKKLAQSMQNLEYFGDLDLLHLSFDRHGGLGFCSSFKARIDMMPNYLFSNRFMHFLSLVPNNCIKFYSEQTNLFAKPIHFKKKQYVVLIKKSDDEINLFIFFSQKRSDIVMLLLHKDVMKRMALFVEEKITLNVTDLQIHNIVPLYYETCLQPSADNLKSQLLSETLLVLLTKKEREMVEIYLKQHTISAVVDEFNFSRSYVNQILLSSAHKLGLSRIQDLLMVSKTSNVLLYKGSDDGYGYN